MVPKNYEPFDETYYLQKNELYQFLEKNLNFLSINQKKIIDTHSSFYKGFMSLVQHSRNQSQRIPSENRILNYKNFDKSIPERQPQINGMNKPTYFPNMNMNKLEENEKENEKVEPTVKSISGPQAFNTFLQLSSNDYSQKYSYPYHKENNNNNFNSIPNLNKPPIQNQNFPGQVMTRSFQNQTQLNQFLALRNNFKQSPHSFQDTSPQIPNLNVYGNQMKIAHNLNSNLYSFQSNYPKYHQNIYINNSSMRVNNTNLQNEANNFGDDIQGKYVEENGYKNFSYLPDHIPKKMNATFYPNNNEASMYYKNLEVHRENNEYLSNGYTNINTDNNRNSMNINGNSEEINLNDYSTFEKKYDNKNEGLNLEENYLASEHDEFKIKRINSMTKFNGQKQFEDFIANNPENRINFND